MKTNPIYLSRSDIHAIMFNVVENAFGNTEYAWHPEDAKYQIEVATNAAFAALEIMFDRRKDNVSQEKDVQF